MINIDSDLSKDTVGLKREKGFRSCYMNRIRFRNVILRKILNSLSYKENIFSESKSYLNYFSTCEDDINHDEHAK